MVAPLVALNRMQGAGTGALDRLASSDLLRSLQTQAPGGARGLATQFAGGRQTGGGLAGPRQLQSLGGIRSIAGGSNPYGAGGTRSLGSAFGGTTRRLVDPYAGTADQNQPGLGAMQGQYGGAGGTGGAATAVGGQWAALDAHNNEINVAAQQTGVPANLIKAMINNESSGDWARDNRVAYIPGRNSPILPFVGIFQETAQSYGIDWNSLVGNKQNQITAMATIISRLAQQYGGYENAALVYFGGPAALNGGFVDEFGMDSGTYGQKAVTNWHALDQMSGGAAGGGMVGGAGYAGAQTTYGTGTGAPPAGTAFWAITGGTPYAISQGFGLTDWAANSSYGQSAYGYSGAYGVQGHDGVDVAVPYNTALYTPQGGTVQIAGGTGYYNDSMHGGPGELLIQFDNGDQMILGHMSAMNVAVGQRVSAGQAVGRSGGENGDHVHVEIRKAGGGTSSGYLGVDPRDYFGGGWSGGYSGGGAQGANSGGAPTWGRTYGGYGAGHSSGLNAINSLFGR